MSLCTIALSENRDLRTGEVPWRDTDWAAPPTYKLLRETVDVAIIGTGILSTFAIATPPSVAPLRRVDAMIWEASDPYLYVRIDKAGRVIAGGEDIDQADAATRDALISEKAVTIAAKLEAMLGAPIVIDRQWAATFGASPDGPPAIGRSSLMPDAWITAGYGGNGIAFASPAAQMLEREIAGEPDPDRYALDPYRFDESVMRKEAAK